MPRFEVSLSATISDVIEVEADSYEEAERLAEDSWDCLPLASAGYTTGWDMIQIDDVQCLDEDWEG